jgi:putative transposase
MARLASAQRAGSAISRFYDNCKKGIPGKKGYPQFQKDCRSVEYKTSGRNLRTTENQSILSTKKGLDD